MKTLLLAAPLLLVPLAFTRSDQVVRFSPRSALQGFNPLNPSAVRHPVITGDSMAAKAVLSQFTVTNYSSEGGDVRGAIHQSLSHVNKRRV